MAAYDTPHRDTAATHASHRSLPPPDSGGASLTVTFWHGPLHAVIDELSTAVGLWDPCGVCRPQGGCEHPLPAHTRPAQGCDMHRGATQQPGPDRQPSPVSTPVRTCHHGHPQGGEVACDQLAREGVFDRCSRCGASSPAVLAFAPNAGLSAYPSWIPTLQLLLQPLWRDAAPSCDAESRHLPGE